MTEPISILIVDDHEVVRKGLRSYLDTLPNYRVVGEASTGEEAIKIVEEYIPDVVLMDLIMPGMDGVETTRRIKKISPRTQVVVLTSFHEDFTYLSCTESRSNVVYLKRYENGKAGRIIETGGGR